MVHLFPGLRVRSRKWRRGASNLGRSTTSSTPARNGNSFTARRPTAKPTTEEVPNFQKPSKSITQAPDQGDQIGRIFNIWLLFTWVFLKFYLNKQFQNTVCCTYFNIQKQFDATIFDFQFELFVIWLQFWLHFRKLGNFFKLLVTLCITLMHKTSAAFVHFVDLNCNA